MAALSPVIALLEDLDVDYAIGGSVASSAYVRTAALACRLLEQLAAQFREIIGWAARRTMLPILHVLE